MTENIVKCAEQYDQKQIKVDFDGPNKRLMACVNKIFEENNQNVES